MIQAIFFDIDGTLVSFKTHTIPSSAIQALQQLQKKGILLFIATGRGKDGLECLGDFPFDGYITLNGQYCFDKDGRVVYENTIHAEDLQALVNYEAKHHFPCGYVLPEGKIYNYRDERCDEVNAITHNDNQPAGDVSNIAAKKVYQVMTFLNEDEEKELMTHLPNCTSARWYPTFCDISPKGGTKVKGMDVFAKVFGFDMEHTMAFGDGGNDIPMLRHAGISIAMANAADSTKAVSTYITDDPDHDGILHACQHFHLI
ncbi:MAG: Cof-type HAD-IIB family hydrolase [Lactimicrobium massiliense]|nr:Cof-type HAD-IIB family hydrolase [Lactimicrobium massiliense]MDD6675486.1 Cof-type HAD-IIB family hydrolase [Lactimicrobium massiliense]